MPRMREVGRCLVRPGPSAAHEWEPLLGSCHLGTVASEKDAARMGAAGVVVSATPREATMNHRRLVGIDLGIASAHTVRVLDGDGTIVAKRKAVPTVESLGRIEAVALA